MNLSIIEVLPFFRISIFWLLFQGKSKFWKNAKIQFYLDSCFFKIFYDFLFRLKLEKKDWIPGSSVRFPPSIEIGYAVCFLDVVRCWFKVRWIPLNLDNVLSTHNVCIAPTENFLQVVKAWESRFFTENSTKLATSLKFLTSIFSIFMVKNVFSKIFGEMFFTCP